MRKKIDKYTPYHNGVWDRSILEKMKNETGFDPNTQEDGVNPTEVAFAKEFVRNVPRGKIIRAFGSYNSLIVHVEEMILDDDEKKDLEIEAVTTSLIGKDSMDFKIVEKSNSKLSKEVGKDVGKDRT